MTPEDRAEMDSYAGLGVAIRGFLLLGGEEADPPHCAVQLQTDAPIDFLPMSAIYIAAP